MEDTKISEEELRKLREILSKTPLLEIIKELQLRGRKGEISIVNDGERVQIIDRLTGEVIAFLP